MNTTTSNSSSDAYSGPGGKEQIEVQPQKDSVHHVGPLPYTGFDVGVVLAVGVLFALIGVAVSRLAAGPAS